MAGLDNYATGIKYPDFIRPRPSRRYCLRGLVGAQNFGIENIGPSTQTLFAVQLLANSVNNDPGHLDLNVVFGGALDGGVAIPANKITDFIPGVQTNFVQGNTITGATEYSRAYVEANGGATEQLLGQGVLPPGATVLLEFPVPVDVEEYTVLIDITEGAEAGER